MRTLLLCSLLLLASCGGDAEKTKTDSVPADSVKTASMAEGEGNYVDANGLRQGKWEIYGRMVPEQKEYAPGSLVEEGSYQNNLKEGEWKEYRPDGSLKVKGPYVKGKKSGRWTEHSKEGVETGEIIYYSEQK